MRFSSQQISPEKWGIYGEAGLLATVSCQAACDTIIANLKNGRRDVPTGEINSLYQVPKLQKKANPSTAPSTGRRSNRQPISTRKTRRLKVSPATPQVSVSKAAEQLTELQKQRIKMTQATQATRAASQAPQADKAERA